MLELFKIVGKIALDGAEAVEKGLAGIDKQARKTDGRLMNTGDALQRLGGKVSSVGGSMTKWVTGPLAAATAGVGLLAGKASEYTKELDRMAQVSNASTKEFQRQAFAVKTVGIESDKYADILKDMNDRVGDFVNTGGGPMADFFEQIAPKVGVTAEQFRNLSGPDALQLYVNSLEKANLSQEQMTFYMEAIASDSTALLPLLRNNGQAMEELGNKAEEAGLILSEKTLEATRQARGEMGMFKQALDVVSVQIGSALIPVLQSLIPVLIDVVVPAAKTLASVINGLVGAFTALPGPIQTVLASLLGIAAAAGPVLMVVGKFIGLMGTLTKAFALARTAALLFTPALVPILVAFGPIIAIVAVVAAGIYALVKAVEDIIDAFGSWQAFMSAFSAFFGEIWAAIEQMAATATTFIGQKLNEIVAFFTALPGKVVAVVTNMVTQVVTFFQNMGKMALQAVRNMVSQVVNYVRNMAANVINSIKSMFMAVVGNSIIPDMARGVLDEFAGMTDGAVRDTEGLVKGVNKTLDGINGNVAPQVNMEGSGGGRNGNGGGGTTIDMRHAIIRDDKDMLDRMRRRGLEMTGAF